MSANLAFACASAFAWEWLVARDAMDESPRMPTATTVSKTKSMRVTNKAKPEAGDPHVKHRLLMEAWETRDPTAREGQWRNELQLDFMGYESRFERIILTKRQVAEWFGQLRPNLSLLKIVFRP
jgi:hypothetical protein